MYQIILAIQCVTLAALFVESWIVFKNWKGLLHSYLFLSCIATFVNSMGYLLELTAQTEDAYFTALRLSYLGRVWAPFALLLFAAELVKVRIPHPVKIALAAYSAGTYIAVLTTKYTGLYYQKRSAFYRIGEFRVFRHENGIWHHAHTAALALYIIATIWMLVSAIRKERDPAAKKRQWTVLLALLVQGSFTLVQMLRLLPVSQVYDISMLSFPIGAVLMFRAILSYDLLDMANVARQYVVDELSEGIIAVNTQGAVAFYNKPARTLFPELQDAPQGALETIRRAIDSGEPLSMQEHIYRPQANALSFDGLASGTLYSLVDETEHYRYLDELKEQKHLADAANEAKSSFLANMSHEIRTPINAILGMDEMILRESGEREIVDYAENIESAGKTLLSLINDILDLSKIEEGKMEILPAQYDLSSLINDLVNMTRPRAEDKGLRFVVEVDGNIPHALFGDEIRIRQCAINILTNAAKYTPKGSVTLAVGYEKLTEESISLRIRVSDTGIGMKPEDMEKLFAPFERIEEERNRNIEGTGLGMSITKQLLALMGSRLEVASVYGEGSTFSFAVEQRVTDWAPIGSLADRYQASAPRKRYRELFRAPNARILVVDDTPVNLSVIRGLLKKTRVQVVTAASGREALAKARQDDFDVFFIDHMMPELDGIETLRELKKLPGLAEKPAVALTANAIAGAREMYLEAGFSDYLSKPVDGAKLEKLLMEYLPPEKVLAPEDDAPGAEESEESAALPEWLGAVDGLDTKRGLAHCGSPKTYLETLTICAKSARAAADEIESFHRAGDAPNTAIKVHALKSVLRTIGAETLGALAEKLELAGKAGDTKTLFDGIPRLLERFRALGGALAPLCAQEAAEEDESLPLISDEELREAYDGIRELAANLDSDNANYMLDCLKAYRLPEAERGRVEELRRAIAGFDWDRVNEILS